MFMTAIFQFGPAVARMPGVLLAADALRGGCPVAGHLR
jgi:hypothetical protein